MVTLLRTLDAHISTSSSPESYPRIMAKISKLITCHAVGLGHMSRYMRVVYGSCSFKVHQFILKTGGFYKLREARARFKRLLM